MNRESHVLPDRDEAIFRIEIEEILRVIHLCDPMFSTGSPLTFEFCGADPALMWEKWKKELFYPEIAPRLARMALLGRRDHTCDISQIDAKLSGFLTTDQNARCMQAGSDLLTSFIPPRGTRSLDRMQEWTVEGTCAPNFISIFAIRSGIFSIPVLQVLIAYMFKEWHSGHLGELPLGSIPDMEGLELVEISDCLEIIDPSLHVVGE